MFRDAFVASAPAASEIDEQTLESELSESFSRAQKAHAPVELAPERFAAHLGEKLAQEPTLDALRKLSTADLYLAVACGGGDDAAIARLERHHLAGLDRALARFNPSAELIDEVKQRVRARLLTCIDGRPPRILEYGGKGSLGGFITAIAVRTAIDLLRSGGRDISSDDTALIERAVPAHDTELELMKRRYGIEFESALRDAMGELDPNQRRELRLYYIEGLTLTELARLARVTPSTISRRLASARQVVLEATRRIMRSRFGVSEQDLQSIVKIVASRLDLGKSALDPRT